MTKQSYGWWLLGEDLCVHLTRPPADITASDRQFERLLQASRLWFFAAQVAGTIRAAWLNSRLRSWTHRVRADWPSDPDRALAAISWVITVSAATSLAVQALKPGGFDPLSWAVPVTVGVGAVILSWVARRIPRAGGPRKSWVEFEKR